MAARHATGSDIARTRARTRCGGVRTRLVALVLVPVCGMAVFGGFVIDDRSRAASAAARIRDAVPEVVAIVGVEEALHHEIGTSQIVLRAAAVGTTADAIGNVIGIKVSRTQSRAATDRALRRAPDGILDVARLRALRRDADAGRLDAVAANDRYRNLSTQLVGELRRRLDALRRQAMRIANADAIHHALDAVGAVSDLLRYTAEEITDVSDIMVESDNPERAHASLGRDHALVTEARQRLDATSIAPLRDEARAIVDDPKLASIGDAIASELAGRPVARLSRGGIQTIIDVLGAGFDRDERWFSLMVSATKHVAAEAEALRSDMAQQYRTSLYAQGALAAMVILDALALGRSITRPLRRLAATARAVSEGRLDVEPLPAHGLHEHVVVHQAFNDLVANLSLLEAKSRALADYDLANPVLSEPLPGRLGEAIEDSVNVLSGSIEEREQLQQRLAHQATHDTLTGMRNRAAALSVLEQALARAQRDGTGVAVLFIDLDDFKRANDTHGHDVGDAILRGVAQRLEQATRAGDLAARLGGDEFLVVAERIVDVNEAVALAHRVMEAIAEPIATGSLQFSMAASVGVALALDGDDVASQLIARADLALYRAKAHGRGRVEMYDESLQAELVHQADVEADLAAALDDGGDSDGDGDTGPGDDELLLYYQPFIDSATMRPTGVEALIRWRRDGRLVPPDDFIPIAEASDLIIDVDVWVLRRAARQLVRFSEDPLLAHLSVAVNVSGRHLLSRRLATNLRSVLAETGADPERLVLEITETVLLRDLTVAAAELDEVRATGVRVYIDDFGTGYTSIAHLHHLPVDAIKIDRSFVRRVEERRDHSLIRMITDLGHQLGIHVVAEGVETEPQQHALHQLGCDEMQGYLISRPQPPDVVAAWLHDTVQRS
jgi:diguanylate cyclase (GGDEF)-like protein